MIYNMDPILSAAAAAIVGAVNWKEVAKKLVGDAATDAAKAGQQSLLRLFRPDEREKAAKQAIVRHPPVRPPRTCNTHYMTRCCPGT